MSNMKKTKEEYGTEAIEWPMHCIAKKNHSKEKVVMTRV